MADAHSKQVLELLSQLASKVDGLEKKLTEEKKLGQAGYRLICSECVQCIDVPQDAVRQCHGVGAGRDWDGSYDSGYSCYSLTCPKCKKAISRRGTLTEHLGNWVFKVTI